MSTPSSDRKNGKSDLVAELSRARTRRATASAPTQLEFQPAQVLKALGIEAPPSPSSESIVPTSERTANASASDMHPTNKSWVHRNDADAAPVAPHFGHTEPMFVQPNASSRSPSASRQHELPGPEFWAERARQRSQATPSVFVAQEPVPTFTADERTTESFDIRKLYGHAVPMPEIGKVDDDSSMRWRTQAFETPAQAPIPSESAPRKTVLAPTLQTPAWNEADDKLFAERGRGSHDGRTAVLIAACVVALGLLAVSFVDKTLLARAAASVDPRALAQQVATFAASQASTKAKLETKAPEKPTAQVQPAAKPDAVPTAPQPNVEAAKAPPAPAPAVQQAQPVHALPRASRSNERGAATAQSAAALYMKGQYKEALAEYRLLASGQRDATVYAEFARVLKRKLFDTCVRTQPHRREECKQL